MFIAITMRWPNVHINHSEVFYASGRESFIYIDYIYILISCTFYLISS